MNPDIGATLCAVTPHRFHPLTFRLARVAALLLTVSLWHPSTAMSAFAVSAYATAGEPLVLAVGQAAPTITCQTLLTDAEVETVMGRPSQGSTTESASGSSQCRWQWTDSDATATASFASEAAIRAGSAATKCCPNAAASPVAQFFDYTVRIEQDLGSDLPVPLDGLGQRAVLFFDDAFLKVIVQRADGVIQVSGHVTREQLLALARAMVR